MIRSPDSPKQLKELARTSVRIATDQQIQKLNEKHGWGGARALEPTHKAIQRIHNQKSASDDRFQSWLDHPDERVQIAMARSRKQGAGPWGGTEEERRRRRKELSGQVGRELIEEEACWNPVIDAIETEGFYPYHLISYKGDNNLQRHDQQLEPINIFAYETEDFDRVQPLLAFRSPVIRDWVASHPGLTPEGIDQLEETRTAMAKVGVQDHLTADTQERTFQWVIDVLEEIRERGENMDPGNWPQQERQQRNREGRWAFGVLKRLIRKHSFQLSPQHQTALLDTIPEPSRKRPAGPRGKFKGGMWIHHLKNEPLIEEFNQAHLHRFYEETSDTPKAGQLLAHPKMGPEAWHMALDDIGQPNSWVGRSVQGGLAQHPRAMLDSKRVQEFLMTTAQDAQTLGNMLERVRGEKPNLYQQIRKRLLNIAQNDESHWNRRLAGRNLRDEATSPKELFDIYEAMKYQPAQKFKETVQKLLRHQEATPQLAQKILEDTRSSTVRRAVLEIPWARKSQPIRQIVSNTRDKKLLELLLQEASGEELRTYFQRLANKAPKQAAKIFENMTPQEVQDLGAEQLRELLTVEDRQIRLAALMAASNIENSDRPEHDRQPGR